MLEVLIALTLAVFLVLVFSVAWVLKLVAVGGAGFALYGLILLVKWFLGYLHRTPPPSLP
jgi:hypothetical protein